MPPKKTVRVETANAGQIDPTIARILELLLQQAANRERQQQRQQVPVVTFNTFQSIKPPEFFGSSDPIKARAWLKETEKAFSVAKVRADQKTEFASYFLKEEAKYWWESMRALEIGEVVPWERFTELFSEKYFPRFMQNQMELKFLELKHENLSVSEYEAKFTELARFVPEYINTDEHRAKRLQQAAVVQKAMIIEGESDMSQKERDGKKRKVETPEVSQRPQRGHYASEYQDNRPRGASCFKCGKVDHISRDCRTLVPANNVPRLPAPQAQPLAIALPPKARTFNMTLKDAVKDSSVVAGTLPINSIPAKVLFDSGSTKSFVSEDFAHKLSCEIRMLSEALSIEVANQDKVSVTQVYPRCEIEILGHVFLADLIPIKLGTFDVILGMDWLTDHDAQINCKSKRVVLRALDKSRVVFKDLNAESPSIESIPVVNEFKDVFPNELPGLPPDREIEFAIDLAPSTEPV
nr:PREDICTED: uncharacterized protein LOC108221414 [Daucus carota subsp. sativus]